MQGAGSRPSVRRFRSVSPFRGYREDDYATPTATSVAETGGVEPQVPVPAAETKGAETKAPAKVTIPRRADAQSSRARTSPVAVLDAKASESKRQKMSSSSVSAVDGRRDGHVESALLDRSANRVAPIVRIRPLSLGCRQQGCTPWELQQPRQRSASLCRCS